MRVLVTGGTGFLGSYVVRALCEAGHTVSVLARQPSRTAYLDTIAPGLLYHLVPLASDYSDLNQAFVQASPEAVVHLAAVSRASEDAEGVRRLVDANLLFGALLLQAMVDHGASILINSGTSWQSDEQGRYAPFNFYAATKQAFEDLIAYASSSDVRAVTLRVFDTFGPHDRRNRIADLLLDAALSRAPLDMTPGEQSADLVDVRDTAAAFLAALHRAATLAPGVREVWGAHSGEPIRLRDFAKEIAEVAGRAPQVRWGGRPYRPREIMAPGYGVPRLPDWRALTPRRRTLADMLAAKQAP